MDITICKIVDRDLGLHVVAICIVFHLQTSELEVIIGSNNYNISGCRSCEKADRQWANCSREVQYSVCHLS